MQTEGEKEERNGETLGGLRDEDRCRRSREWECSLHVGGVRKAAQVMREGGRGDPLQGLQASESAMLMGV